MGSVDDHAIRAPDPQRLGLRPQQIREQNMVAVMQSLRHLKQASRSDLAAATGLDRSTLTHITAALLERELLTVQTHAPSTARGGRRSQLLGLDRRRWLVAGVEIRAGGGRWVLANLAGQTVASGSVGPSIPAASGAARRAWFAAILADARSAAGFAAGWAHIIGYGVGVPGLLDKRRTRIVNSFELEIDEIEFADAWGPDQPPVLFANDARCFAWHDGRDGLFAYTKLHRKGEQFAATGMGVGVIIVADGEMLAGTGGAAGELRGYNHSAKAADQLGIDMEALRREHGEQVAVDAAGKELLRNLRVVASVVDPPRIVVAGDLAAAVAPRAGKREELAVEPESAGKPALELNVPSELEIAEGASQMLLEAIFRGDATDPRLRIAAPIE